MTYLKMLRWSLLLTPLIILIFSSATAGSPLCPDIRESAEIGPEGGSIMAEDPETGVTVGIYLPEGVLLKKTNITLVIHSTSLPVVLGKTHIKGISVLPLGLLLQDRARIEVYNPPVDVTKKMILYQIVNEQFIVPLGSQVQHEDENWIEGTFYITGKFNVGTPTASEITNQSKKLAAYNPARPLAYKGITLEDQIELSCGLADNYNVYGHGGPFAEPFLLADNYPVYIADSDEDCLRWQKALTKVEASLTWVEQHILTGNTSAENAERLNARRALQEAIDDYLSKPSPVNRCGRYIKAAAKYLEASILLGINEGNESHLNRHFEQLLDECSFVFTVETREWINHPTENHDDGSTTEEKMNRYGIIKCHIPWNEFLVSGNMKVRGEGNMSLHHENHWVGGDENTHEETNTNWNTTEIEGSVNMNYNESGVTHPVANITIHWKGNAETRIWGKRHGNPPYDLRGSDDRPYKEYKTYPIENGYSEKIGDSSYGYSVKVYILKQPGDERDDPDDCF
jgi:hypothetical protein